MHGNARTFSEQLIAGNIYDGRCDMTDVAFRTASPIGGPSCFCLVGILTGLVTLINLKGLGKNYKASRKLRQ